MASSPSHVLELTRSAFRQEAEELLAELDTALLQLEAAPTELDSINRAFRAMHTLKGSGATAGFGEISALVHDVEDIFNGARAGRVRITSAIIDLVLKVGDIVRRLLAAPAGQGPQLLDEGMVFVRELKALVPTAGAPAAVKPAVATAPPVTPVDLEANVGLWSIHFAPTARIFHTGSDPVMLLRELLSLGHGVVRASTARLCGETAIDPTLCYLSWDVQLATSEPREKLKDVFVFVEDVATVRIEPVASGQCWVLRAEAYFEAAIMQEFRDEAAEDIAEIEAHLLALEERAEDSDHLDGLRRSLHNLKGLSQLLLSDVKRPPPRRHPLRAVSELCHVAESFLQARGPGRGALDDETADVLLQTVDWLKDLVDACDEGREAWPGELLTLLGAVESGAAASILPSDLLASALRGGQRPMIRAVVAQCEDVLRAIEAGREPGAPPSPDAWITLGRVLGTLEKTAAFEGATGVSSQLQALVSACHSAPQAPPEWGSFRERYRSVVNGFDAGPAIVVPSIRPRGRTISIRPSRPAVASLGPKAADAKAALTAPRSIRVDQDKLDVLMGAIGELLVAKNALPVLVARVRSSDNQVGKEIKATVDAIAHIADDLQNAMRQIRMMPIKSVFQRFPRMIRDLSRSENKSVQLIISGDETELDKTVLEQIADPLVHLVRNAVDHGIELPADRLAQGKPEMGTIGLEVLKEGSNVVIRISDDGRGMSPQRLRAKAVEKGLLSEADAAALPDRRALDLIFLPGFSTAETVTDLSGRGVGMDVVQSNIRALHGTIAITSEMGRGSSMSITLPSSLMISKGVLVECASEQYVLPIESIREMVKLQGEQIRRFRGVAMTNIRGAICPVFSLGRLLGLEATGGDDFVMTDGVARAAIVATQSGDIAVVVDRLVAEIDVIVKPLSRGLDKLVLFQGATILGDGSVALILDVRKLDALAGLDAARAHGAGTVDAAA